MEAQLLTDVEAILVQVLVQLLVPVPVQLVLFALLPQQCPLLVGLGVDHRRGRRASSWGLPLTAMSDGTSNGVWIDK